MIQLLNEDVDCVNAKENYETYIFWWLHIWFVYLNLNKKYLDQLFFPEFKLNN